MRTNNPRFSNFCLAVLLACPWGILFCLPIIVVGTQMFRYPDRLLVRTDGLLGKSSYFHPEEVSTLDGKALPRNPDHEFASVYSSLSSDFDDPADVNTISWLVHICSTREAEENDAPALWYFIRDRYGSGLTYLRKYSIRRRTSEGFIGLKGFRETIPPKEERFQLPSYRSLDGVIKPHTLAASHLSAGSWGSEYGYQNSGRTFHFVTRDGVWREVNLTTQIVRDILPEMKFRSIQFAWIYVQRTERDQSSGDKKWIPKEILLARTDSEILTLSLPRKDGTVEVQTRISIPENFLHRDVGCVHLPDGSGLLTADLGFDAKANVDRYLIQRHNPEGKFSEPEEISISRESISPVLFSGVPLLIPPVISGAIATGQRGLFGFPVNQTPEAYLMTKLWPIPVLVGLVCGTFILLHARRNRLSNLEQISLLLFGLLGGFPAVAGYLTHRRWGARITCPMCKRPALLRGEACGSCSAEFPAPKQVGTEIFA